MRPLQLVNGHPTAAQQDMPSARYRPVGLTSETDEGRVYRCFDTVLRRPVELHLAAASPQGFSVEPVDFLARAQALAKLDADGLPKLHDFGYHQGRPFMVLSVPQGRPLAELVADGRRLPTVRVLAIALRVALAIERLHRAGQVHGSLTVSSLVVEDSGSVMLSDLGLLRTMRRAPDRPGWPCDDIRQLGVVMLSLTMGGSSCEPLDEGKESDLQALVDRMVSPRPEERPDATCLVDSLASILLGMEPPREGWTPTPSDLDRIARRTTEGLPAFAPPSGPPPAPTPPPAGPVGRLASFINTVSVTSARWGVGKKPPGPIDLRRLPSLPSPPARDGTTRTLLLLLMLVALLALYLEVRDRPAAAPAPRREVPEEASRVPGRPVSTASRRDVGGGVPSSPTPAAAPQPRAAQQGPDDVDATPSPDPVEMPATPPPVRGPPRVVRYQDGERADGSPAEAAWERQTIPESAEPVRPRTPTPSPAGR